VPGVDQGVHDRPAGQAGRFGARLQLPHLLDADYFHHRMSMHVTLTC